MKKKRRICTVEFYEDLTVCIILKNLYHICTIGFYEDLTVCIILKNLYHIKNYIRLKFYVSYFLLDLGSIVLLHSDSIVSNLKKDSIISMT